MKNSNKPAMREREWLPTTFRRFLDNFWDVDKFFENEFMKGEFMPAVNILDNEKTYEVRVAAPGMKKEDFDVKIENNMLCIAAEREETKEEKDENYARREFRFNSFQRTFMLPEDVETEKVDANYKDGILRLTMKKVPVKKPPTKKIEIM